MKRRLKLKPEKRYTRSEGNSHWFPIISPEPSSTLPEPYYDLYDWSAIGRMSNLKILIIEEIFADDFSFSLQCKKVENLSLRNTNFSDRRLLREMSNLRKADLRQCRLEHEEVLKELHVICRK